VLAIVVGIIVARHLVTADDLFGGPQGKPTNGQDGRGCDSVGGQDFEED